MSKRLTYVEVPLRVDGKLKTIKGVTKYTTCGEVLKMILQRDILSKHRTTMTSYGIFESSRGIERLLPGKSRVLKIMRTWGSATDYEFVLRIVNPVISLPKVSEAKRRKLSRVSQKKKVNEDNNKESNTCENFSTWNNDNKMKLSPKKACPLDNDIHKNTRVQEIYFSESDNTMREFVSTETLNRNIDLSETYVRDQSRGHIKHVSTNDVKTCTNVTRRSDISCDFVDSKNVTMTSHVNEVKYAVRKPLKSKSIETSYKPSTGSYNTRKTKREQRKQDTFHSTPCHNIKPRLKHNRASAVKHTILAQTIKYQISQMNQKEGKEAILQKYFADYLHYRSPQQNVEIIPDTRYRGRGDGAESHSDTESIRRGDGADDLDNDTFSDVGKMNCATSHASDMAEDDVDVTSDSGQEDADFDVAFIDETSEDDIPCSKKLVDYSLTDSDISEIAGNENENRSSVSSASEIIRSVFNENIHVDEDEEMESFMNTKLSDDISDEGLSSLGSDEEREKEYLV